MLSTGHEKRLNRLEESSHSRGLHEYVVLSEQLVELEIGREDSREG